MALENLPGAGVDHRVAVGPAPRRPMNPHDDVVSHIHGVGIFGQQADVERVARKYIVPGAMAIVLVGDRETIEQGVRALDLGPIHNLTIEDVLGPPPQLTGTQ